MDWQFKVGLGAAILFGFMPFAVKDMPQWITWPGVCAGALLMLWGIMPGHEKLPIGPVGLFIACFCGMAGSVAWYRTMTQTFPSSMAFKGLISLSCYLTERPEKTYENSSLYIMQVNAPYEKQLDASVSWDSFSPGEGSIKWNNSDASPKEMAVCVMINYSEKPLFDIEMDIGIQWQKVERTDKIIRSAGIAAYTVVHRPRFNLGISPNNVDKFYISNPSDEYFVYIPLTKTITIRDGQTGETSTIELRLPKDGQPGVVLPPAFITNGRSARPPVPTQPSTPERTMPQTSPAPASQ